MARKLQERHIFIKPLDGPVLGLCYMRVATALPAENARVVAAFKEIL